MNPEQFRAELWSKFPEVDAATTEIDRGLLHCEVAVFRRCAEEAMDSGKEWLAELYFKFVERCLRAADEALANALEVSYLEDLALGEHKPEYHRIVKARMPRGLRKKLIGIHEWWA